MYIPVVSYHPSFLFRFVCSICLSSDCSRKDCPALFSHAALPVESMVSNVLRKDKKITQHSDGEGPLLKLLQETTPDGCEGAPPSPCTSLKIEKQYQCAFSDEEFEQK